MLRRSCPEGRPHIGRRLIGNEFIRRTQLGQFLHPVQLPAKLSDVGDGLPVGNTLASLVGPDQTPDGPTNYIKARFGGCVIGKQDHGRWALTLL